MTRVGHRQQTSRPRGRRWITFWGLAAISATMLGCGAGIDAVPVSGVVTVDGKPVENVAVSFTPIQGQSSPGPGSSGVTDAQGRFVLQTIGDKPVHGAVTGKHHVTLFVSTPPGGADSSYEEQVKRAAEANQVLPPSARDSTLTFDVPAGGTSEANFEF